MSEAWAILSDGTTRTVLLGAALLGALTGGLGAFAVLRRQSLLGDVLAHAALPGIVAAFLLTGQRALPVLVVGALASGALWSWLLRLLTTRTRLGSDGATTLVLSVSFALGLALLTGAQGRGDAASAGLQSFLFGQAAALLPGDVALLAGVALAILALVVVAWPALAVVAFDPGYATSVGVPVRWVEGAVTGALAVAVVLGLQLVGVVLITALVVAPAVAARPWVSRLAPLVATAAAIGAGAGAAGALVSAFERDAATGPAVVVLVTVA
ncbi:MAG: metal ABC transporter permease, partial [Trueperaceae bacterium]|nr:metal ABC transporter permease [Trueperaceae bacterium]